MLFPSFFMGGFECSTHIDRSHRRIDYVVATQHDRFVRQDYERARSAGLRVIREGLRWYLCDLGGGRYDFSSIAPMVDAALDAGITHINCLLHYGFPDGVHPLQPDFDRRFADFSAAFATWRRARVSAPRWYACINELSLLSFAAGEVGWFYPFLFGEGEAIKLALVRASLRATDAIRAVDPEARFLCIDPVLHLVPPRGRPELAEETDQQNRAQFEAWDMALGRVHPELGGGPQYLDVVGLNCYPDSQKEVETGKTLALDDPRRRPFRDMLLEVHQRYRRPIIVAETSARGDERPSWLRYVVDECLAAMRMGVDLHGICSFPLVDMREWKKGQIGPWGELGLWDVREGDGVVHRVPNEPYLRALAAVQQRVERSGLLPTHAPGPPEAARAAVAPHAANGAAKARANGEAKGQPMNMPPVTPTTSPVM